MSYNQLEKEFNDKYFVDWVKERWREEDLLLLPDAFYLLQLLALAFNAGHRSAKK